MKTACPNKCRNSRWLRLALLALLVVLLPARALFAAIPAGERQVLLDMYASTGGASWTNHAGWNGAAGTECSWYGIGCDPDGAHITIISLQNNGLVGSLPAIGGLTQLQIFAMDLNQLSGSLPELSGLTQLQRFLAYNNQFTGAIPSLSGLTNLTEFRVENNKLSGNLPSLTGLVNLQKFRAGNTIYTGFQLSGNLPSFTGLVNLVDFDVHYNQLSGSIPELAGLTKLQSFNVGGNRLTGSIPVLTGLEQLQIFNVNSNQLTGSLPSLAGLASLTDFEAASNQLTGVIPELAGLANLVFFEVNSNKLTGSIPSLVGLDSLKAFEAVQNQLSGAIPNVSGLAHLERLNLDSNQLSGSIPLLTSLPKLSYFSIVANQISGEIPTLNTLPSLQTFAVRSNRLNGPLPVLSDWPSLQFFDASFNRLTGSIPALSSIATLQSFDVTGNRLTGPLPALAGLSNLTSFGAAQNQLTGSMPSLAGLVNLSSFAISNNQLTGTVPALTGLGKLEYFNISSNFLSGAMPDVPSPNVLRAGYSYLCPNQLSTTPNSAWDTAAGTTPWYKNCASPPNVTVLALASGGHGTVAPSTQSVPYHGTASVTVTPDAGYVASVDSSCGGSLSASVFTTPALPGSCTITVVFTGSGVPSPTTTTLGSDSLSTQYGQSVVFSAVVDVPDGSGGAVTFKDGANALCAGVPLAGSGGAGLHAVCTTAALEAGAHSIVAEYSGDATHANSTSNIQPHTVIAGYTTVALSVSPVTPTAQQRVTFTATVTQKYLASLPLREKEAATVDRSASTPVATPIGSVAFAEGAVVLCAAVPLGSAGTAACDAAPFSAGTHTITAIYTPSMNFQTSQGSLDVLIGGGPALTAIPAPMLNSAALAALIGLLGCVVAMERVRRQ